MIKLFFVVCYFGIAMAGCNTADQSKPKALAADDTSSKLRGPDTMKHDRLATDASQKQLFTDHLKDRIIGIWAAIGEENATFVIAKDTIAYPDQNASYKYTLVNDSMQIRFDGYLGRYLVKMRTPDTLILTGDEQQVYYRFK